MMTPKSGRCKHANKRIISSSDRWGADHRASSSPGTRRVTFVLTKEELQTSPVCPHCEFRPALETPANAGDGALSQLDDDLDKIVEGWTRTLLDNLKDPATRENLSLLQPAGRERIGAFVEEGELPDSLEPEFVEALREVLSGLVKVVMNAEGLREALLAGGSPARPDEMRRRFDGYLEDLAKGKDLSKVRIVLE